MAQLRAEPGLGTAPAPLLSLGRPLLLVHLRGLSQFETHTVPRTTLLQVPPAGLIPSQEIKVDGSG